MLWLLVIPAVPLCLWITLGVWFTILNWLQWELQERTTNMRDRLIRYTDLTNADKPHLLSTYDEDRNLICIDRFHSAILPLDMRNRLEMSVIPATMIIDGDGKGLRFGEYQ